MTRGFAADRRGVVAIEFALAATLIATATLNAVDIGNYVYQSMQVEAAAAMAAQSAARACRGTRLPVTTACRGFAGALATAVAGTALGKAVRLAPAPVEAWHCLAPGGRLVVVGVAAAKPASCAAVGAPDAVPGAYLTVGVAFAYRPLLDGASLGALLPTPIRRTAFVRVG